MKNTVYYGFLKPEDNESFDQQAHANVNMDAIDALIKARADEVAAHLADGVQHKIVDAVSGSKYVWKVDAGQMYIEEVG